MPSSFGRKCELSTHLRRLNLSHNRFTKFPERTLSPLINLEFLSLADNNLTEIPFSLFQLTNLLELDLGNNKLKSFPTKIIEGATGGNKVPTILLTRTRTATHTHTHTRRTRL
jgi:Leucine-rich repeat (LRR) protein